MEMGFRRVGKTVKIFTLDNRHSGIERIVWNLTEGGEITPETEEKEIVLVDKNERHLYHCGFEFLIEFNPNTPTATFITSIKSEPRQIELEDV